MMAYIELPTLSGASTSTIRQWYRARAYKGDSSSMLGIETPRLTTPYVARSRTTETCEQVPSCKLLAF